MTLKEAYEILRKNARYSSGDCKGFVYLSQIEELLEVNPKYNQELVEKVRNREIVIEVDGFQEIKDLISFIYTDDPYLEDEFLHKRKFYFTTYKEKNKVFWASNIRIHKDMEAKPRVKAIDFIVK